MTVLERGWLSANNIVLQGRHGTALVDSGYCTHAAQTLQLVAHTLQGRSLDRLLNTHLHSDHCGGNAALQAAYPNVVTHIPPGQATHVSTWDANALSYTPTGQTCPPFKFDVLLQPGTEVALGERHWQVHAAPGHDPHSVVFFEPISRVLLSADALWEHGFGVIFPELEGIQAMDEVAATLDLIERLAPQTVVPGHGRVFHDAPTTLATARKRLDGFVQNPLKHAHHAAKVLLKFKLLELHRVQRSALARWTTETPYFHLLHQRFFADVPVDAWFDQLLQDLVRAKAAEIEQQGEDDWILDV